MVGVHCWCLKPNLQVDIVATQILILQILQHLWLLFWQCNFEWLECLRCDDPRGYCRTEVLGVEGTERHVLPDLQITGTPIIEKYISKDMVSCVANLDWVSQVIALSDNCSEFELEVKSLAVGESWGYFIS